MLLTSFCQSACNAIVSACNVIVLTNNAIVSACNAIVSTYNPIASAYNPIASAYNPIAYLTHQLFQVGKLTVSAWLPLILSLQTQRGQTNLRFGRVNYEG
ncbi:MAG: hypothetical protein V7K48_27040 [Nostoc sp.]|uniref:hypothetical protein n=1 Tax=Nostoc sp. TaxID=1180 RepID=UPI002FF71D70